MEFYLEKRLSGSWIVRIPNGEFMIPRVVRMFLPDFHELAVVSYGIAASVV
jgi:hypothetical protein